MTAQNEAPAVYEVTTINRVKRESNLEFPLDMERDREDSVIAEALAILDSRIPTGRFSIDGPRDTKTYLRLKLSGRESEAFACLWLDNRHRVIGYDELFFGTIDSSAIHPREVVRAALRRNAAAVIFAHNHPSGDPNPSAADRSITSELREAMRLIGTRTLDHIIIGEGEPCSMAEHGLM